MSKWRMLVAIALAVVSCDSQSREPLANMVAPPAVEIQNRTFKTELETTDPARAAALANEARAAASRMCYKDYCPCSKPQNGFDELVCDQLEAGVDVDVRMMISGRARRRLEREYPEYAN